MTPLTKSQSDILVLLSHMPDAGIITVGHHLTMYPANGAIHEEVKISGGRTEPSSTCASCGKSDYSSYISLDFYWKDGRFVKGSIFQKGSRKDHSSLTAMKKEMG